MQINYPINDQEKIQIAGPAEVNFVKIEKAYNLKVLTRSPGIVLKSPCQQRIQMATKTLDGLRRLLKSGHELSDLLVEKLLTPQEKVDRTEKTNEFEYYLQEPVLYDRWGKPVHARTQGQARFVETVVKKDITFVTGPSGTGKTFLAVAIAVSSLQKKNVSKIVLVRPAVESGEYLGFLPGDLREKIAPYMTPLFDALNVLISQDALSELRRKQEIEIAPLAYMRGRTLNNCFILLDEGQNTTIAQMKMFLTRMGVNSKIVVTGDETQKDLPEKTISGLTHARHTLNKIKGISQLSLSAQDVIRHRMVKEIIQAYEQSGKKGNPDQFLAE